MPDWHLSYFPLFSNRFTSISQQRNCLLLPRVQWTALVPAGRATSALWAGVLQCRGACPLCVQGWRNRVDLSYPGVWFAELELAARYMAWVSPITRHRAMVFLKERGGGKDVMHIMLCYLGLCYSCSIQVLGHFGKNFSSSSTPNWYRGLAMQFTGPLCLFGYEQYRWVHQRARWKGGC